MEIQNPGKRQEIRTFLVGLILMSSLSLVSEYQIPSCCYKIAKIGYLISSQVIHVVAMYWAIVWMSSIVALFLDSATHSSSPT